MLQTYPNPDRILTLPPKKLMTMKNPSLLGNSINRPGKFLLLLLALFSQSGCAVVAVADAAVTVVATGVKVGAAVVGTTVDVAAAGVKAATGGDEDE